MIWEWDKWSQPQITFIGISSDISPSKKKKLDLCATHCFNLSKNEFYVGCAIQWKGNVLVLRRKENVLWFSRCKSVYQTNIGLFECSHGVTLI